MFLIIKTLLEEALHRNIAYNLAIKKFFFKIDKYDLNLNTSCVYSNDFFIVFNYK